MVLRLPDSWSNWNLEPVSSQGMYLLQKILTKNECKSSRKSLVCRSVYWIIPLIFFTSRSCLSDVFTVMLNEKYACISFRLLLNHLVNTWDSLSTVSEVEPPLCLTLKWSLSERRETGKRRPTFSWGRVRRLACFENLADSLTAVYSQGKETDCFAL